MYRLFTTCTMILKPQLCTINIWLFLRLNECGTQLSDCTILVEVQMCKELIKAGIKIFLHDFLEIFNQPCSVRVIHETIVIHPHDLVSPEPLQHIHVIQRRGITKQEACME